MRHTQKTVRNWLRPTPICVYADANANANANVKIYIFVAFRTQSLLLSANIYFYVVHVNKVGPTFVFFMSIIIHLLSPYESEAETEASAALLLLLRS